MRKTPSWCSIQLGLIFLPVWLTSLTLFAAPASAQTCEPQGAGYLGGAVSPILSTSAGGEFRSGATVLPGETVRLDATAYTESACTVYSWNGSACVPDYEDLNTFSILKGWYRWPSGFCFGTWCQISHFAIDPETGFTDHVTSMDTRNDLTTTPGPIVTFSNVQAGLYIQAVNGNPVPTACDATTPLLKSGHTSFFVSNALKDICPEPEDEGTAEDERSQDEQVGNPCSPRSGAKSQREVDFAGPVLPLIRYYNSKNLANVGFGHGWRTRYHGRRLTRSGSKLLVLRETGYGEVFNRQPDDSWLGDADTRFAIEETAGGYELTTRKGDTETYDTLGRLVSETDPAGNLTSYTYDPVTDLVTTVTGPYGHTLSFAYNLDREVTTATLPDGSTIQYTYAYKYVYNSALATVTYPDASVRTYHYENSSYPWHLTGITDENGVRYATFAYQSDGRAIRTEHATTTNASPQEKFTLAYSGLTTTVTDPRSYQDEYVYSQNLGRKNLIRRKHLADGLERTQTFDTQNNLTSREDELGQATEFAYNATNQMTSRTEAAGTSDARTTSFTYQAADLDLPTSIARPSVAAGESAETEIVYHATLLEPTSITQSGYRPDETPVSRTTGFEYDPDGRLIEIDGSRTDVSDLTELAYHACTTGAECGQLASVTNALGHTTTFDSYDDSGRLLQATDPLDTVTAYSYDGRGRVLAIVRTPTVGTTRTWAFSYDDLGQLETSTSPSGVALAYTYDAAHDLRSIEDGDGNKIEYLYDLAGNRTSEKLKDPGGALQHEIQASYDTRNRLSEINEGGSVTELVFDAIGQLTSQTDPNDHDTDLSYDPLGRLQTRVDALSGVTDLDYAVGDSLSELTAPNGVATGYASDDLGNTLSEDSPDRGELAYAHDAAGNVTSFTHLDSGRTVAASYDALSRVLTRDYAGTAEDVAFGYDTCLRGTGRLCSITHASGTTSFEYDAFGNVTRRTEVIEGDTYITEYVYDADDRVTQISYPSGHVVDYTRDDQGRIASVALDTVNVTSGRSYRGDGLLLSQSWGNGLAETRTYNGLARLATLAIGSVEGESYSYDAAGNLTDRVGSAWTLGYGYDAIDRLTSDTGGAGSRAYTYDADGNRLTLDVDATPTAYTYTTGTNRLATVGGDPVTIDAEGRTTATATHAYAYNAAGRLESVETGTPLTEVGRYAYDAFGLRRTKVAGAATTVYHYDQAGNLLLETDDSGAFLRLYVWAGGTPVAQKEGSTLTRLHVDHLNTPRWGTDASGDLVWRWKSDGFGQAAPDEDVDGDETDVVVNLRFPGQYHDAESGLAYNWHRYYEPGTGRYVSTDPIGQRGGTNLFLYTNNQPLSLIDPLGLEIQINGSADYRANVQTAIDYGKSVPDNAFPSGRNPLRRIDEGSERVFTIEEGDQDFTIGILESTIRFDPKLGLEVPLENGCGTAIQSPGLILLHEAGHGADVVDYGALASAIAAALASEALEQKIIDQVETPAALFLGEPTRSSHTGTLVPVSGPTSRLP